MTNRDDLLWPMFDTGGGRFDGPGLVKEYRVVAGVMNTVLEERGGSDDLKKQRSI